jgi:regulator of protease activity HflC (stomatin/prohibitin superfamily)/predicted small lipoprotein YifL
MKLRTILIMLTALTTLTACGEKVEVPPAHVGKILTSEGYREQTVMPSKFRLPACLTYCDKLITLETSDKGIKETMQLFMPKDQLNMTFDIRATVSISNNDSIVNKIFDRVVAGEDDHISIDEVYEIYAKQKFRSITRSILSNYKINQIAENREAVEQKLFDGLVEALKPTPIKVLQIGLADVQFPSVIVKAKETAKEREVAIQQAEAEKLVALTKAEGELELAKKDRLVRLEKALTIKEENELTAKSVTEKYLKYKQLEVMEAIAKSGSAIYIPIGTDLVLVGDSKVIPMKGE